MRALFLCLATPAVWSQTTLPPLTQPARLQWALGATVGPPALAGGAITSAWATAFNAPPEYGPHWSGWGKRQALRLSGAAPSNLLEAELGALWGEDPRYRRAAAGGASHRMWHAVRAAFLAYGPDGEPRPAYARYAAIPASNILSNTWRPDSQRTAGNTAGRIGLGFLSRIAANTFAEFWPDIRRRR
jgi:hypothetical protein